MSALPRILFILKQRQGYLGWIAQSGFPTSSGLTNSACFLTDLLRNLGYTVGFEQVIDANQIDREVTSFRPDNVVLEAIWVPPDKFKELVVLHPNVKWVIRVHSEIPFLAQEGMSLTWLPQYVQYDNVSISANSDRALEDLRLIIHKAYPKWKREVIERKVIYLPNYYPACGVDVPLKTENDGYFDVGCFGAVRPMKNQLIQAVAAVDAAHQLNKQLKFHVNATRVELGGDNILKNLRALMAATGGILVEEPWVDHCDFIRMIGLMDVSMQVSLSETFNIVAADSVMASVPIVVSPEVRWACDWAKSSPTDSKDIARTMIRVINWKYKCIIEMLNVAGLKEEAWKAKEYWLIWLGAICKPRRHFGY